MLLLSQIPFNEAIDRLRHAESRHPYGNVELGEAVSTKFVGGDNVVMFSRDPGARLGL